MYLVFAREEQFDVTVSGLTERYYVMTEGDAVEAAFSKQLAAQEAPPPDESDEERRAAFAQFYASVEQYEFTLSDPEFGDPYPRVRLDYSDGGFEECRPANVEERIRAAFLARTPGAQPPKSWASAEQWRRASNVSVLKVPGWGCTVFPPAAQPERQIADLADWSLGAPMSGIVEVLNRYGRDGWTVCGSAEDKVVYARGTQAYEHPSRLRYLLGRPVHDEGSKR